MHFQFNYMIFSAAKCKWEFILNELQTYMAQFSYKIICNNNTYYVIIVYATKFPVMKIVNFQLFIYKYEELKINNFHHREFLNVTEGSSSFKFMSFELLLSHFILQHTTFTTGMPKSLQQLTMPKCESG